MATALALPIDVAWKRLAISQDMYAQKIDDDLPQKWRSSLSVFAYEPPPDPTDATGEVTTFLKVVASITGYNHKAKLAFKPPFWWPHEPGKTTTGLASIELYYPALCAAVQLAVFPPAGQGNGDLSQYPYIADFEPKKREIIETKTETGEVASTSTPQVGIRKSTTTTDRTESGESSQHSGSRVIRGGDVTETIVTDASREQRETYSYNTSIAQLYQLLDSYHTGTNRALFLVSARPHLQNSVYTFVNGPRKLEGIQEFFVVIRRPKTLDGICVKATLETAHLDLADTSDDPAWLFATARAVSGCTMHGEPTILPAGPWVTYETPLPQSVNHMLAAAHEDGQPAVVAANAASRSVRDLFIGSFREGTRYPLGQVDLLHTNFAMRKIIAALPAEALAERPELRTMVRTIQGSLGQPTLLSADQLAQRRELVEALVLGSDGDHQDQGQ